MTLKRITLRDFVIVQALDLDLAPGFTALPHVRLSPERAQAYIERKGIFAKAGTTRPAVGQGPPGGSGSAP